MARKGTIVVDIKKENPLLTIIKAGKIPVVRLAEKGFQNYKQKSYFTNYKDGEYIDSKCNETQEGCFVSLAGVQGNYVCGGHYGEAIHIGYLEPNDIVFSTHTFSNKNGYYCELTAKERFEQIQDTYEVFQRGVKNDNWDPDDFDLYSEAIVDSKKIRKVMIIEPNEYQLMLPYCKDGLFRIFDEETIFHHMVWDNCVSEELASYMHWNLDANHHFFYKDVEIYSLMESKYYKELILEEVVQYYTNGSFIRDTDFYDRMQNAIVTYMENIRKFYPKNSFDDDRMLRYFGKDYLRFYYEENNFQNDYSISADSQKEELSISIAKRKKYSYEKEYETIKLTEKNILSQEHRNKLYNLIEMKNIFVECLGEFVQVEFPRWMHILETFKKLEDKIQEWHILYSYDEKNYEILFEKNDFRFLYNLILLDGVVETTEDGETQYYNLDKLPASFNRVWLDIILEILNIWESLCYKNKFSLYN